MTGLDEMLSNANDAVPKVSAKEAHQLLGGVDALLLDVRDPPELLGSGKLKGALNVSRGMLEFRADPQAISYDPEFRRDRPIILYCIGRTFRSRRKDASGNGLQPSLQSRRL